jgi:hypothetical protein
MDLSPRVLGRDAATKIAARAGAPLLKLGSDVFYRRDLAAVGCFNFMAAATLSRLAADLGVRNTRHLFEHTPPSELAIPHLGAVALAVLGAAFEARGLGGDHPLETWVTRHRAEGAREFVTFDTLKHQAAAREIGERKAARARKARKAGRRDKAQRLRGDRYIQRHEVNTTYASAP